MVPAWRGREQLPPKSQKFGQNQNFSGSNKKNSDKIRNFKAVARNYLSKTKELFEQNKGNVYIYNDYNHGLVVNWPWQIVTNLSLNWQWLTVSGKLVAVNGSILYIYNESVLPSAQSKD